MTTSTTIKNVKGDVTPLERNKIINKEVMEEETLPRLHQKIANELIEGNVVLDLGCGSGHMSRLLPDKKFYNVDCVKRNVPNFQLADLSHDKIKIKGKADVALLIDVLEHLENPWHIIREAKRLSKSIIISVPVVSDLRNKLIYMMHGRFYHFFQGDDDHTQPIFPQQLRLMRGDWKLHREIIYKDPKGSGAKALVQKWVKN